MSSKSIYLKQKIKRRFHIDDKSSRSQLKRFNRSKIGTFFYLLAIISAGAFSVLPLIYCVSTSFKPLDELLIFPPRFIVHQPTLQNYKFLPELLSGLQVPLTRYTFNTLFVCIVGTVVNVFVASMCSFSLAKSKLKLNRTIFLIIQFSLMFSAYTLSIPRYLIHSKMGIIDTYWVYLLPSIPSATSVFLMKQYVDSYIPDTLLESAEIDGAGFFKTYGLIGLPTMKPVLLTVFLFAFRDMWGLSPSTEIFTEELKTLQMMVPQLTAGGIARSGSSMAMTVLLMIPPICIYLFTQSNVMETMNSAGIKG